MLSITSFRQLHPSYSRGTGESTRKNADFFGARKLPRGAPENDS